MKKGEQPVIYGDGEQTRDFAFVSDVVAANMKAATVDKAAGRVINIATGQVVTLNELLKSMCRILDRTFNPGYEKVRAGDIRHSSALTGLSKDALDWVPAVAIHEGLQKLLHACC